VAGFRSESVAAFRRNGWPTCVGISGRLGSEYAISSKFQVVIPKEVRDKLHLTPRQRLLVVEKGGVITLVPEVPLKSLKGALKGMTTTEVREKKDRT